MAETRLGRYQLESLLATGGMGEVWLARRDDGRRLVVKRILRHLARDQGFIDLFVNEARLAARLRHPHIVEVFALEQEDDTWFISMEYVQGKSLRAIIETARAKGVRVPLAVAVRVVVDALRALHHAHELKDDQGRAAGIIHRDFSPENVLVSLQGQVKLADFGIARAMSSAITSVGRPKGKLAYVAPELTASGAVIDRRTDVYAVGVVLHELLTLERPACSPASVDELGAPRRPYGPRADLPGPLNHAIARALAVDPQERWPTALAMADELEAWVAASGHTREEGDVAAFLRELLGGVAVTSGRGAGTDIVPVFTAQPGLSTQPVMRAVVLPPGAPPPAAPPRERTPLAVALTVAGITAVLFIAPIVISVVGPRPGVGEPGEAGMSLAPQEPRPASDAVSKGPVRRPPRAPARKPARLGRVEVRANPATEVLVNGKVLGTTPMEPIELPAGNVTLVLRNAKLGVVRKVPVVVVAGQTAVVKVTLVKKK